MNELTDEARSERFGGICEAIGFTLWQLQTLEGSTAQFFVLVEQAVPQMGEEQGNLLVAQAQRKTFGGSIAQLAKSNHLPTGLLERFQALLKERNWLVHSSNADSERALADDAALVGLHGRLGSIVDEARGLLKEISALSQNFVLRKGISKEDLKAKIAETLLKWQSS